jgi:hypothetical protein
MPIVRLSDHQMLYKDFSGVYWYEVGSVWWMFSVAMVVRCIVFVFDARSTR